MKRKFKNSIYALALLTTMSIATVSCSDDEKAQPAFFSVDSPTYTVNKLGLNESGDTINVKVLSNTYWTVQVASGSEWLATNIKGGNEAGSIKIRATRNDGAERSGSITLEALDGSNLSFVVKQTGATEAISYLSEDFDKKDADMISMEIYKDQIKSTGVSGAVVQYDGVGVYADNKQASAGYEGASGKNNILFKDADSNIEFGRVDMKEKMAFNLQFASHSTEATFDKAGLKVYISLDNSMWFEVPYTRASSAGWSKADAKFYFAEPIPTVYFKIEASKADTYRIDDILLGENAVGTGTEITFRNTIDDGKPVGFEYYFDNFDWVIDGGDYFDGNFTTTEVGFNATMSEEQKALWLANGWTAPAATPFVYLRKGYLKVSKTKFGGVAISPKLAAIDPGKIVNGELTLDVALYATKGGTKDVDGIVVEIANAGTIGNQVDTSMRLDINSWNTWKNISFQLYGITSETQIKIRAANMTTVTNRFFMDNVKVVKTP